MLFERLNNVPEVLKLMVNLMLKFNYTCCWNLGYYSFTIVPAKGPVSSLILMHYMCEI